MMFTMFLSFAVSMPRDFHGVFVFGVSESRDVHGVLVFLMGKWREVSVFLSLW